MNAIPKSPQIDEVTQAVEEGLSSTESEQEVEIQFDSRYALGRTS